MLTITFFTTFIIVGLVYSFLAAFAGVFYRNKPISELSQAEIEILDGKATFWTKIGIFLLSLISTPISPPAWIIAGVVTLLVYLFTSYTLLGGVGIFVAIIIAFALGWKFFMRHTKDSMKNKVHVLKMVEPGYNDWADEKIVKQIKAIEECGYKWFEQKGRVGFKHTKTGLYLKIEGLHFYNPEEIKRVYREVWSKDDPSRIRNVEATAQKMAEAISSGATDEEIESILEDHKKKKNEN